MEETELRGHHVECLAERHIGTSRKPKEEPKEIDVSKYLISIIGYPQDKAMEEYKADNRQGITSGSLLGKEYDEFLEGKGEDFLQELLANPDRTIVIARGHDSLCRLCPRFTSHVCQPHEDDEGDKRALEEFGLEEGRTYAIRELLERFEDYQTRTGFASPRQKKADERDREEPKLIPRKGKYILK